MASEVVTADGEGRQVAQASTESLASRVMAKSGGDIGKRTNEWITACGGPEEQLKGLKDIFEIAGEESETVNGIVTEAWAILVDRKLWRLEHDNEKDGLAAIDNPLLKDIRTRAVGNRKRKGRHTEEIKKNWAGAVGSWEIESLGENRLGAIAAISKRYELEEARSMLTQIAVERLRGVRAGRGSSREIITSDWQELGRLADSDARSLLEKPQPSAEELESLQADFLTLTTAKRAASDEPETGDQRKKRRRYPSRKARVDIEMGEVVSPEDDTMDEESVEEEIAGASSEMETRGPVPVPKCKCRGVAVPVLERVLRKTKEAAGMFDDAECVKTLREFIKESADSAGLDHVCHRHLYRLGGHIGLQVKMLKTSVLRARLQACWAHRSDLGGFRGRAETSLWWRLQSRPWTEQDDHGVYAKRLKRRDLLVPISANHKAAIVDEIAGAGAWSQWEKDGNRRYVQLVVGGGYRSGRL